ncbi:hypothetical protein [Nocardia callitridis]|uniref:Uncharacterized protein n=1 Tax=Nocardia callitridis TaxID=648753 RepID=A0ABP9KUQ2_9NOCA
MVITPGARMVRRDNAENAIRVTAIRRNPIPYAEIEPFQGGHRRVLLLQELERDFRVEPALPAPA